MIASWYAGDGYRQVFESGDIYVYRRGLTARGRVARAVAGLGLAGQRIAKLPLA